MKLAIVVLLALIALTIAGTTYQDPDQSYNDGDNQNPPYGNNQYPPHKNHKKHHKKPHGHHHHHKKHHKKNPYSAPHSQNYNPNNYGNQYSNPSGNQYSVPPDNQYSAPNYNPTDDYDNSYSNPPGNQYSAPNYNPNYYGNQYSNPSGNQYDNSYSAPYSAPAGNQYSVPPYSSPHSYGDPYPAMYAPDTPMQDPDADPTADPDADPTAEPDTDPTAEPDADSTAHPDADPTADPDADSTADPAADSAAAADTTAAPTPAPTPSPTPSPAPAVPSDPLDLGLLADLPGTWVGSGFTLTSLPDFDNAPPSTGPQDFRLLLHSTKEILEFTAIGGSIPNRGVVMDLGSTEGQPDIQLHGITYLQRVSDAVTNNALHIEPGIWINVPATTTLPVRGQTYVRLGTIPHGNSLMAESTFFLSVAGGPFIAAANSTPTGPGTNTPGYLDPYQNTEMPPGIASDCVLNPNLLLKTAILNQTIIKTAVIAISTSPVGGIVNIPFVVSNANASRLDAVFWIETVQQSDGSTFLQLQYTQTITMSFLGIDWPHISVATLVKQ